MMSDAQGINRMLLSACREGDAETVTAIVEDGADVNVELDAVPFSLQHNMPK